MLSLPWQPPPPPPQHPALETPNNTGHSSLSKLGCFPRNPFLRISLNLWAWLQDAAVLFWAVFYCYSLKNLEPGCPGARLPCGLGQFPWAREGLEMLAVGRKGSGWQGGAEEKLGSLDSFRVPAAGDSLSFSVDTGHTPGVSQTTRSVPVLC